MEWTPILVALIPTVAGLFAALIAIRDFNLRRDIEVARQFATFVAAAHGRPTDGRSSVGLAEQLAYLELVISLAKRHPRLRPAAMAALGEFARWDGSAEKDAIARVAGRGVVALERRPPLI